MLEPVSEKINDPQFMFSILIAIAAVATVLTVAMPMLESDTLGKRMKAVSIERDRIRARERERIGSKQAKPALRQDSTALVKSLVENFNLSKWLSTEQAKLQLAQAGYRGKRAEDTFLVGRLVAPVILFFLLLIYLFGAAPFDQPAMVLFAFCVFGAYLGIKVPELYLKNKAQKRQFSMRRAFPDALDLLLICCESGMSIEHSFRRVAAEMARWNIAIDDSAGRPLAHTAAGGFLCLLAEAAHAREHSLETQLPFLQYVLGAATVRGRLPHRSARA